MLFHCLEWLKCPKLLCCCMFLHGRSLLNDRISLRSLLLNIYWCCLSVLSKTLAHSDAFREMYGPPAQKTKKCVGSSIFFQILAICHRKRDSEKTQKTVKNETRKSFYAGKIEITKMINSEKLVKKMKNMLSAFYQKYVI